MTGDVMLVIGSSLGSQILLDTTGIKNGEGEEDGLCEKEEHTNPSSKREKKKKKKGGKLQLTI